MEIRSPWCQSDGCQGGAGLEAEVRDTSLVSVKGGCYFFGEWGSTGNLTTLQAWTGPLATPPAIITPVSQSKVSCWFFSLCCFCADRPPPQVCVTDVENTPSRRSKLSFKGQILDAEEEKQNKKLLGSLPVVSAHLPRAGLLITVRAFRSYPCLCKCGQCFLPRSSFNCIWCKIKLYIISV